MKLDPEKKEIAILKSLIDLKNKDILEVGCGDGRITEMLNQKDNNILAIEPDKDQLRLARKKVSDVKFEVGTMSNLKTKKTFDLIIFSMSFHHVPARSKKIVIQKALSLLNKNGEVWLIEPALEGQVCEVIIILMPAERKRIEDANKVFKELRILKKKSVELKWYYENYSDFLAFFKEVVNTRICSKRLDKIKKIMQIKDEKVKILLKDKINYFLIKN